MLKIHFHGGKCCGIKTIAGFSPPESFEPTLEKRPFKEPDRFGNDFRSDSNMYPLERKSETCLERLDEYLRFLKEVRPEGLIECTIASWQSKEWDKLLKERGFNLVATYKNSNSGYTLRTYLKITTKESETQSGTVVNPFT